MAFTLIQHILELVLGLSLKSNKLDSESITLLPSDDGKSNDDRRPSTWRLHLKTHTRLDGELDMALNLTSGECQVPHNPMARPFVSRELDRIVDRHSRSTSWLQLFFVVLFRRHHVVGVPTTQRADSNRPS